MQVNDFRDNDSDFKPEDILNFEDDSEDEEILRQYKGNDDSVLDTIRNQTTDPNLLYQEKVFKVKNNIRMS
jgi:hypothetical protein